MASLYYKVTSYVRHDWIRHLYFTMDGWAPFLQF